MSAPVPMSRAGGPFPDLAGAACGRPRADAPKWRARGEADPGELATGVMAALQGGYLLAQTERSTRPMETALDMALAYVRAIATDAPESDA